MKCDESLPSCRRCLETGRKCEGPSTGGIIIRPYSQEHHRRHNATLDTRIVATTHWTGSFAEPEEARAFDFYLKCAAPSLGGLLDRDFWLAVLPQLCIADPAVKHAVLAISTLYEHPLLDAYHPPPVGIVYSERQRRALNWYAKSVSTVLARSETEDELKQIETGLLTCLLFTSVEVQQVNIGSTVTLLEKGFNLVARYTSMCQTLSLRPAPVITSLVVPILVRQTILFGIFGHYLCPSVFRILDQLIPAGPIPISSLEAARDSIYAILVRSFFLIERATVSLGDETGARERLENEQTYMLDWLQAWRDSMQTYMIEHASSARDQAVYNTLCCYERVVYLWVSRCTYGYMHEDDEERQSYSAILSHAESALAYERQLKQQPLNVPFVLELTAMPALFFVGWQCRDTEICRRAASLMRQGPVQEYVLVTGLQIDLVQRLIAIEEHPEARTIPGIIDRSLRLPRQGPIIAGDQSLEQILNRGSMVTMS